MWEVFFTLNDSMGLWDVKKNPQTDQTNKKTQTTQNPHDCLFKNVRGEHNIGCNIPVAKEGGKKG